MEAYCVKCRSKREIKNPEKITGLAQWRKRVGTDEANKISTQASRRGTRVHNIIEDYLNNDLNGQYNDNPLGMDMFTMIQPTLDGRLDNIHAQEVALLSLIHISEPTRPY